MVNLNSNIKFTSSFYDYDDAICIQHLVQEMGMNFIQSLYFNTSIEELIKITRPNKVYHWDQYGLYIRLMYDDAMIVVSKGDSKLKFYSKSGYDAVDNLLRKYGQLFTKEKQEETYVRYYYSSSSNIEAIDIGIKHKIKKDICPEFYPDVDIAKLAQAFKESSDSLLILQGDPGVGKTTFLKYLIVASGFSKTSYCKDMSIMCTSKFWTGLTMNAPDILVLDDLDFALGSRTQGGDNNFVSNLLSYSDGIFGREHRAKIVITTNQNITDIDAALIRPGRCFDFIALSPLSRAEANKIWIDQLGHTNEEFESYFKNDRIYQSELMNIHNRLIEPKRMSYMKREVPTVLADKLEAFGVNVSRKKSCGF